MNASKGRSRRIPCDQQHRDRSSSFNGLLSTMRAIVGSRPLFVLTDLAFERKGCTICTGDSTIGYIASNLVHFRVTFMAEWTPNQPFFGGRPGGKGSVSQCGPILTIIPATSTHFASTVGTWTVLYQTGDRSNPCREEPTVCVPVNSAAGVPCPSVEFVDRWAPEEQHPGQLVTTFLLLAKDFAGFATPQPRVEIGRFCHRHATSGPACRKSRARPRAESTTRKERQVSPSASDATT